MPGSVEESLHVKKKKHKKKRDEKKQLEKILKKSSKSGIDPMLEPFGDEAEEELRKKLEKRLKRKMRKKTATSGTALEDEELASGIRSVVNTGGPVYDDGYNESRSYSRQERDQERRFYYDKPRSRNNYDEMDYAGDGDNIRRDRNDEYLRRDRDNEYFRRDRDGGRGQENFRDRESDYYADNRPHTAPRRYENRRLPPGADRERNWDAIRPRSPVRSRRYEEEGRPFFDQGDPYNQREHPVRAEWADRGYARSGRGRGGRGAARSYTGYGYQNQRGRSRSRSPPDNHRIERQPSPPRAMPEHLRWLHDRWSKYDKNFFSQGDGRHGGDQFRKGTSQAERASYNQQMQEYRHERSRGRGGGAGRRFMETKPEPRDLKSQFAEPYYKFRKGGEYHWNPGRMYTFKEFLMTQPEDLEDQEEAVQKYNEYKLQFRQQSLSEFFKAHSEDEWFLEKYHPIMKEAKDDRKVKRVQKRLDVFMQMLVRGWMEANMDLEESRKVRKLMDAVIVFLEGGDEGDAAHLNDLDYILEEKKEETYEADIKPEADDDSDDEPKPDVTLGKAPGGGRTKEEQEVDEAEHYGVSGTELEIMQHAKDYTYYIEEKMRDALDLSDLPDNIEPEDKGIIDGPKDKKKDKDGKSDKKAEKKTGSVFITQLVSARALEEMNLHKSSALLIRNVPPSVTRVELEEICSSAHGGFLRIHLTEPDPNNGYFRQAICSFWSNANLRKVCWKIRGTRLRGVTLIVIEFREFKRRLHLVDGLAADKSVVLRDIQLCKSLIEYLDRKYKLWGQTDDSTPAVKKEAKKNDWDQKEADPPKLNPLLLNLDECLAFHLHELMEAGEADPSKPGKPAIGMVDRDDNLTRVLDRLILYLRIVHSVDYYGCTLCDTDDDMPRRVGAITVRGSASRKASPKSLASYIREFEERLKFLLPQERKLADEHVELLGKRDTDTEIEKFVSTSFISLKDGLTKCCLCYKRFTSEEFARMHITEKHKDKIEEVKWVVITFNNYLADPARPCSIDFSAGSSIQPSSIKTTIKKEEVDF